MAYHVACPITCNKICFCELGFPLKLQSEKSRDVFLEDAVRISRFLADPLGFGTVKDAESTVQVYVPKVVKPPPAPATEIVVRKVIGDGVRVGVLSPQNKRVEMPKKSPYASLVAEDYARRLHSGELLDASRDVTGEELGHSGENVMCRMCLHGENEGSERARKMLPCKTCGKKYHRSCIQKWGQHRDLFHWSSWTCPSCRICELCQRTGDPNKFLFCKRCDGAYHCHCQHPPHKNVSAGPYLCQKHTRCHSCGSNVPGNGLSVRWFLGYTCCDACGRLFVKGNYCPVCLKVYRDSESTPMVCCDDCQRWVHIQCDGISDEKYMQYQDDGKLQYKCATCRGECYEVKDLEDAVRELWRRRDDMDHVFIATHREAAGLPTQEEVFSISPYSDDDIDGPILLKNEFGRSLKFSIKGSVDKSPIKPKALGNKSSTKKNYRKKGYQTSLISKVEPREGSENYQPHSDRFTLGNNKIKDMHSHKTQRLDMLYTPTTAGSMSQSEGICSINQPGVVKHKFVDEFSVNNEDKASKTVRVKSNKSLGVENVEDSGKSASKPKTVKGTKLVIHLGSRNKNVSNSPRSDTSSCLREQELTTSNGTEDTTQQRTGDKCVAQKHDFNAKLGFEKGNKVVDQTQLKRSTHGLREGNLIKLGKVKSDVSDLNLKVERSNIGSGPSGSTPSENVHILGKQVPELRGDKVYVRKHIEGRHGVSNETKIDDNSQIPSVSQSLPKDSKPFLKLKLKNPYHNTQSLWAPQDDEEKSSIKGQRSKRKRASTFMEKTPVKDGEDCSQAKQDQLMDEIVDANWILKKLGKDAIGKRVEVHLPQENSWEKGVVADVIEGTSMVTVDLDDGTLKPIELGKQGIRFVSQKQKRSKK